MLGSREEREAEAGEWRCDDAERKLIEWGEIPTEAGAANG
jgi:hypothetical protein